MNLAETCMIGGLPVGPDHPVRVVAELGVCHRGDMVLAKEMVHCASEAGADFIKFEVFQLDSGLTKPYRETSTLSYGTARHGMIEEKLFKTFTDGYLSFDQAAELCDEIKKTGKPFFATTISTEEVDFMIAQGACAVKLSSGEIDHYPIIHHAARRGIPVFLDTAKTYMWEIVRAYEEFKSEGGGSAVIMVNPPGYPTAAELTDLRRIKALNDFLGTPVGLSCHTPGRDAINAAIGMGAAVIEKPMSPDKNEPYIEYVFSENMADYKDFVANVREVGAMLGRVVRCWGKEASEEHLLHRHGVVTRRALPKGHRLTEDDIAIARPGFGVRPEQRDRVIGRVLVRDLAEGEVVRWEDI